MFIFFRSSRALAGCRARRLLFVAATVVAMASAGTATAQSPTDKWGIPGSPRGQKIAALLDAIASGDPETVAATVESEFTASFASAHSMAEHQSIFRRMHDALGADFEPAGLRMTSESSVLIGLVAADGSARFDLEIAFDPGDDYRISSLEVDRGEGDGATPRAEDADGLRALLDSAVDAEGFGGVLLIGGPDGARFVHAVGQADKGAGSRNRPETAFNIGSNTKDFTSAAILLLRERGSLELHDTIGDHLEGFPPEVADRVTIHQLLTHTSGWSHYWDNPDYLAAFQDLYELDDYLEFIREIPLEFEPGSQNRYSNTGYEVLGAVVEAASGLTYSEFLRTEVFEPLGMDSTGNFGRDLPHRDRARGYTNDHPRGPAEGFVRENTYLLPPRGTAAGGSFSTVGDLHRFWSAILGGRLLSSESRALFLTEFEEGVDAPTDGESVWAGGGPGVRAYIGVDYGTGRLVILLANTDGDTPATLHRAAVASPVGR